MYSAVDLARGFVTTYVDQLVQLGRGEFASWVNQHGIEFEYLFSTGYSAGVLGRVRAVLDYLLEAAKRLDVTPSISRSAKLWRRRYAVTKLLIPATLLDNGDMYKEILDRILAYWGECEEVDGGAAVKIVRDISTMNVLFPDTSWLSNLIDGEIPVEEMNQQQMLIFFLWSFVGSPVRNWKLQAKTALVPEYWEGASYMLAVSKDQDNGYEQLSDSSQSFVRNISGVLFLIALAQYLRTQDAGESLDAEDFYKIYVEVLKELLSSEEMPEGGI